jgi:hypothetical protein
MDEDAREDIPSPMLTFSSEIQALMKKSLSNAGKEKIGTYRNLLWFH